MDLTAVQQIKEAQENDREGSFSINLEKCMQKYQIDSSKYDSNLEDSSRVSKEEGYGALHLKAKHEMIKSKLIENSANEEITNFRAHNQTEGATEKNSL